MAIEAVEKSRSDDFSVNERQQNGTSKHFATTQSTLANPNYLWI